MNVRNAIAVAGATLITLVAVPASAQTIGGVTFHGFVSQGFLKSTDNNWLTVPTSECSFAFTEAALNFTVEPVSRLRIGGQFYARDLGAIGNHQIVLDWAVGDYRFNRTWELSGYYSIFYPLKDDKDGMGFVMTGSRRTGPGSSSGTSPPARTSIGTGCSRSKSICSTARPA